MAGGNTGSTQSPPGTAAPDTPSLLGEPVKLASRLWRRRDRHSIEERYGIGEYGPVTAIHDREKWIP